MSPQAWSFRVGKAEVPATIRSRLVVNTAEAAVDASVAGLGITRVLSYQMADARRKGTLAVLLEKFEPAAVTRQPCARRTRSASPENARVHRLLGTAPAGKDRSGSVTPRRLPR